MKPILHIYSRVSSESQEDGGSLEAQQESGIQKSVSLGMDYKVWNEGAASSSNDNLTKRPVLRELLTLMEEGEVRHLFVWNTDRLSRNEEVWHYLKYQYLSKYDVNPHTPSGQFNLNDKEEAPYWTKTDILGHEQYIVLACLDKGRGIPSSKIDQVFDAYQQTRASDRYQGAGLGLAITKGLAVELGGGIGVQSREGCGSLFWLVVPSSPTRSCSFS